MKIKCQCCGLEQEFADGEQAFQAGWDAPPHFSQVVCCNLCPASGIAMGVSHNKAHKHWERHGRPADFNLAKCALDPDFIDPESN